MTVLLTRCPFCDSNFMLLDTEEATGRCVTCSKTKEFTADEISKAETERDAMAEKYIAPLEKAYGNKDIPELMKLTKDVAEKGVSSWYAWYCVGWCDLHEGRTGTAFDDFKIAVLFLDEENFDEFYELVMDATLTSLEERTSKGETWSTEDTSIVDFTSALSDRFEHLYDEDFMCDLLLRLGTVAESLKDAAMGADIVKEITMMVIDYLSSNLYVMDLVSVLNNAKASVADIGAAMEKMAGDGSMTPNLVKIWCPGVIELYDLLLDIYDRMIVDYSDDDLIKLCEYWAVNDFDGIFNVIQNIFEFHLKYIVSNRHNKGILKKRDQALKDYEESFRRPLAEGLASEEGPVEEYDRICPDCGKPLTADGDGLVRCGCGFKSRVVTAEIDDLPEDIQKLTVMGRRAFDEKNPKDLNNIGEKILGLKNDEWHGFAFIAASCMLDGEICESAMMVSQAVGALPKGDEEEFAGYATEIITSVFGGPVDESQEHFGMFVSILYGQLADSPAEACDLPMRIIGKAKESAFDDSSAGSIAVGMVMPTLTYEFMRNPDLQRQREICKELQAFDGRIAEGNASIKKDDTGLKSYVDNVVRTHSDLLGYLVMGMDSRMKDPGSMGFLAGRWTSEREAYRALVEALSDAFIEAEDENYNPKSKHILKAKHAVDRYLDSYFGMGL